MVQEKQATPSMTIPADFYRFRPFSAGKDEFSAADVHVVTSGGLRIPAHSSILASGSPVLDKILDRIWKRRNSNKDIPIPGVPCNAVVAFVRFLYSSRCSDEEMEKYGIHLLVLSHVFSVPALKRACTTELAKQLTVENVVDMLHLARLCDAPSLNVKCMNMISKDFKDVGKTEAWKFLQDHDPVLELDLLQFLNEAESRENRRIRNRKDQSLYLQLSEAMECLQHICTEGCTNVGPCDQEPNKNKGPCKRFSTCRSLQLLIRHFATCEKRVRGGCSNCKRMWQLLRLHSSICDQPGPCKVPLCRQFKLRMQAERKGDDKRWRLLVRKVVSAKAISTLSKRMRGEDLDDEWMRAAK
ncbi:hypothetical protein AAC387_Pa02g3674 [Persea americana]